MQQYGADLLPCHEVAFGHHANKCTFAIDDRQSVHPSREHDLDCVANTGVDADGKRRRQDRSELNIALQRSVKSPALEPGLHVGISQ